eukprot:scaffold66911_cov18-Tisochrysis_lutea.AAC.1
MDDLTELGTRISPSRRVTMRILAYPWQCMRVGLQQRHPLTHNHARGFCAWDALGYYEDTDLAMAVRAHGYHVYMQPLAVVYHQEGSTLGTDESGVAPATVGFCSIR